MHPPNERRGRSVFAPIFDAFNEADNIRAEAEKLLAEVPKLTAVEAEAYLRLHNLSIERLSFLHSPKQHTYSEADAINNRRFRVSAHRHANAPSRHPTERYLIPAAAGSTRRTKSKSDGRRISVQGTIWVAGVPYIWALLDRKLVCLQNVPSPPSRHVRLGDDKVLLEPGSIDGLIELHGVTRYKMEQYASLHSNLAASAMWEE